MKRKYLLTSIVYTSRTGLLFIALSSVIFLGTAIALNIWVGVLIEYLTADITTLPDNVNTNIVLHGYNISDWITILVCRLRCQHFFNNLLFWYETRASIQAVFYSAGILSLILGFDDLFRGHETVYPLYLGITENAVYVIYVFLMALFLVAFRKEILKTEY